MIVIVSEILVEGWLSDGVLSARHFTTHFCCLLKNMLCIPLFNLLPAKSFSYGMNDEDNRMTAPDCGQFNCYV